MKQKRKLLSLLTALTITASAFSGFAIPASAADDGSDVAVMAVDSSLGTTTITSDYTFIAANDLTAAMSEAGKINDYVYGKTKYATNKGNSTINGTEYANVAGLKSSGNYVAFNVASSATVTVYGNSGSSSQRYFIAGTTAGGRDLGVSNAFGSGATTFEFKTTSDTVVYIASCQIADGATAPADGDSGGDVYIAGFTVEFESAGETQAPATEAPAGETQAPADETQAPADETQAPADETQAPADETTAPADETQAPADETPAPAEETEAPTTTDAPSSEAKNQNNSINMTETFGDIPTPEPDATAAPETWAYKNETDAYTWDVTATRIMGGITGGGTKTLDNPAISLTANDGKDILVIPNGAGGNQKDLKISFDAGVAWGQGNNDVSWALIFKATDGTELFRIKLFSGGWVLKASLVVNGEEKDSNYAFTNSTFTKLNAYISFGVKGGKVTLGDLSAAFDAGSDLGSISVEYDKASDSGRPYVIDNFSMQTVDKQKVTFNIKSDTEGESVEGAVLTIGEDVYTVPSDGKAEVYYLTGTYTYDLKLAKHKAQTDTFTVAVPSEAGKATAFVNIPEDVTEAALIHAVYKADKTLDTVSVQTVTVTDGQYIFEPAETGTYLLWDSLAGMKPVGTLGEVDTPAVSNEFNVTLEYVGDPVPTKVELAGGEEYIYLPTAGNTTVSEAFTAAVYDQADLVMDSEEVVWSLPGQPDSISIDENGVITLTPDYVLTDDNGVDVVIRATVKSKPAVSADTTIHIHNIARVGSWDIAGPAVIKDGTQAEYSVANLKDQYGNDYTGDDVFVLTSTDEKAVIEGLKITPNTGTSRTEEITLTMALESNPNVSVDRKITAYGYDFYEPGTGEASYGTPRMEEVNGVNSIVWPKSQGASASTTITLPVPVELSAGSAKMITFDNIPIKQTVGSQERSLTFKNSNEDTVISIDFAGSSVVKDWKSESGNYTGTEIGKLNALGVSSSALFVLKTNAEGVTSAVLQYNGTTLEEYEIGKVDNIASFTLSGGKAAPDDRLLTLTNIIISDSDVAEVEIIGDDTIAKVSGMTATKKFKGSIFSQAEGETFEWTVAGENGNAVDGVSIDENGVLSVADTVAADTKVVISYTSSLSTAEAPKLATHEVTIKDFANVTSFDIDGPVAVNAGETVTYSVSNVVDEYGDTVTMPVTYAITAGDDIASINAATGVVTTTGKLGTYTVSVTVGNPNKTKTETVEVTVAKYSAIGDATNATVDVTTLANYTTDTKYLVTTATAEGVLVNQTEATPTDGKVTVDMTGAAKYEVSPIYSYDNVGNVSGGKEIPICDGRYEFTFVKSNMTRGDIYVNGIMVGNNVDQDGKGTAQAASSPAWTVDDVLVQGGKAVVTMNSNAVEMKSITVKKNPSIVTRKTHLYILGDSLVADYHKTFDYSTGNIPAAGDAQTGWGQVLDQFISDELNVTNLAESGNYAKGLYSPAFTSALASAQAGDYIIIECGYNDKNYSSASEMITYLEKMAEECKAKGVTIIMSGPNFGPVRGDTNSDSAVFTSDVLKAAEESGVLGINLSAAGKAYYEAQGWTSDYWGQNFNVYFSGAQQDNLHLSYHGAMVHASLIAQAISNAQNDTTNPDLAASLAGLKLDKTAKTLTDNAGNTITLQVQ